MSVEFHEIWVYLSQEPLLGLTVTLIAYLFAQWLYRSAGFNPLANPVLIAVLLLVAFLYVIGMDYHSYFQGAQFIHFLLGPATVALAVPLYNQLRLIRQSALALVAGLLCGSITATVSAVGLGWALGASEQTLLSLAPKSVTTPIAMGITQELGGLPSLTAVLVILTGITGAMFGPMVLDLVRVKDFKARGLAIGVAAHGIGTARAMQVNEVAGAFSSLAMGLNGVATAILIPILFRLFV